MVYVTHDQTEAMTMADRIVVMNAGRIEQVGAPLELYNRPATRFVAGFLGAPRMNFINGRVTAVDAPSVAITVAGRAEPIRLDFAAGEALPVIGDAVMLGIRPEAIDEAGDLLLAEAKIAVVEALGRETLLYA